MVDPLFKISQNSGNYCVSMNYTFNPNLLSVLKRIKFSSKRFPSAVVKLTDYQTKIFLVQCFSTRKMYFHLIRYFIQDTFETQNENRRRNQNFKGNRDKGYLFIWEAGCTPTLYIYLLFVLHLGKVFFVSRATNN